MTADRPGGTGDRLLPWSRVRDIAGISRSTAWRLQQAGRFPAPVPLSPGRVGWWESELDAWKLSRLDRKPLKAPPGRGGRKPQTDRALHTAAAPVDRPPLPTLALSRPPWPESPSKASGPSARPASPPRRCKRGRPVHPNQIDFGF
ncbi:AlpA family phage regulatory protein [Brevundimonas sp. S30B]|uniref:helix-turn-helix transcriptional regulator n=1 Tax=unclassified Brevundimonas TaxID=2622653 RepID=UPI0010724D23|nr:MULTISPECIES: AlpA family phage regulatory protein [unclassified Brevundimonas]QBX38066.1 AlpA family phage regulatory protein [Brevundimonas sp. MF30-B]TFW02580.1 AlpA family phage regulatory protein [Brevundimonas sp. S30B]